MKVVPMAVMKQRAADLVATGVTTAMLLLSGAVGAAEFTDRVNSARAIDSKGMRESAKSGADNFGFIIGIGGMVIGLVFLIWGIIWVASASRSEGRKPATAGWVMILCGGALGGSTGIFMWIVGAFTGASGG